MTWSYGLALRGFERFADVVEPVHRPVAGVVAGLGQPVDVHVVVDPVRGGQLR
jgi:hypothetical protein